MSEQPIPRASAGRGAAGLASVAFARETAGRARADVGALAGGEGTVLDRGVASPALAQAMGVRLDSSAPGVRLGAGVGLGVGPPSRPPAPSAATQQHSPRPETDRSRLAHALQSLSTAAEPPPTAVAGATAGLAGEDAQMRTMTTDSGRAQSSSQHSAGWVGPGAGGPTEGESAMSSESGAGLTSVSMFGSRAFGLEMSGDETHAGEELEQWKHFLPFTHGAASGDEAEAKSEGDVEADAEEHAGGDGAGTDAGAEADHEDAEGAEEAGGGVGGDRDVHLGAGAVGLEGDDDGYEEDVEDGASDDGHSVPSAGAEGDAEGRTTHLSCSERDK